MTVKEEHSKSYHKAHMMDRYIYAPTEGVHDVPHEPPPATRGPAAATFMLVLSMIVSISHERQHTSVKEKTKRHRLALPGHLFKNQCTWGFC